MTMLIVVVSRGFRKNSLFQHQILGQVLPGFFQFCFNFPLIFKFIEVFHVQVSLGAPVL